MSIGIAVAVSKGGGQLFTLVLGVALLASYKGSESKPRGEPPYVAESTGSLVSGSSEAGSKNIHFDLLELLADRERTGFVTITIGVEVVFDGDADAILAAGVDLYSPFPGCASGNLSVSQIRALAERPEVRSIRLPGGQHPN